MEKSGGRGIVPVDHEQSSRMTCGSAELTSQASVLEIDILWPRTNEEEDINNPTFADPVSASR